ncbi:hypothetical protein Niako_4766 [Niastella koreensis GR20-10]|uniref:Secreted protein n=1 Tax=Niastella koreensis (strain DSM 17620 / KACC 11465 / NBRC 106392 / GR20-10) TaxID=700598 RepID=G8TQ18_NIAKG|nr:hypothetical protein Niako_4766 [Niastella koreensis GR20-10]
MNKSRMIVLCIIVLGIAGSAYAFISKKNQAFCVSNTGPNQNCFVIQNMIIEPSPPPNYWYQVNWDGQTATCVGSNNCPTPVHLLPD